MATPANPAEAEELTRIATRLRSTYGKGKFCPDAGKPEGCLNIDDITRIMANSRSEPELRRVWEGWHTISVPMRHDYERFVELSNKGARELGFPDTGGMWRAKYDMPPDTFTQRGRPPVGAGASAVPAAACLRAHEAAAEVRRRRAGGRSDSGAPARQHLGAGLVESAAARRAAGRPSGLLADRHSESAQDDGARHGPHRRALLHLGRLRAAAARPSGRIRCSSGPGTARSSATPVRGTSI